MMKAATLGSWSVVFLALISLGGCQGSAPMNENLLQLDEGVFEVTGPFAHDNVTVFLLHSDEQDDRDFITLDQGLKDGVVKVSEQKQAQVGQLEIDNQSDKYLFLQEGDRVIGGQQDRIIITSLVVPPKSGVMPLPSFCVEAGRWRGDKDFRVSRNTALAPKDVRNASKVANEQGRVWDSVRVIKQAARDEATLRAPNTNTSLNETLDSPQIQKVSDECDAALRDILNDNPRAVGVAIAVNGVIEEVNVYPNRKVLGQLYPRLLQSYALQAALTKDKAPAENTMAVADVRAYMTERKEEGAASKRDVNNDNTLLLCPSSTQVACQTLYEGKVVHRQWLSKGEAAAKADMEPQRQAPNSPADNVQRQQPQPAPQGPKQ